MPNHVDNIMTITGPPERVAAFVKQAEGCVPLAKPTAYDLEQHKKDLEREGKPLDTPYPTHGDVQVLEFHCIVPLPDDHHEVDYTKRGQQDERDAWGVKWGAYGDSQEREVFETRVVYKFRTAWSSPDVFVRKASLLFPKLIFGVGFGGEGPCRGRYVYANGELTHERDDDHTMIDDELKAKGVLDEEQAEAAGKEWDEDAWFELYEAQVRIHIHEHALFVEEVIASPHYETFTAAWRIGGQDAVEKLRTETTAAE
jgi:hypothetical protein